jgi:thioredoxin reductase
MVMVENREEVKSLIKVLKREPISKDLTVVLITENQNVTYEEDIYSITFKHEDLKDFSKKVERLLINIGDKSESTFNLEFNAVKDKKNYLKTSINYALDMQNETFF